MNFNEKIIELRKSKKLSQEKLAEQLNVTRQAVAKWENGEAYPDINNIVLLSNLFNISIDKLLKNDNCLQTMTNKAVIMEDIIDFLLEAKKNTYAGGGIEQVKSTRPKSHDLIYELDKYKYIDTYLGGERFIGEEAVFVEDDPIWAMNYCGIEINEKFSGKFLKQALSNVTKELPYRGPNIYQDGDYIYVCNVQGNFECFHGKEEIYAEKEKVYECRFHGGIIK